ncbi:MAG: hypothetical protein M1348_02835, partial [Candidatus Parvarchaeota archaeon]|nr:hypothetical protein [Candidatus Parvarchaeota archaeon]
QNTLNSFSNALSNLSSELNIGTSSSGAFSPGISGFAPLQVNSASCSTTSLTLNVYNSAPYEVCFYSITIVDAKRFYNGSSYPLVTGITFNFRYPLSNCIGGGAYGTIIEDSSTVSPSGQFIAFTCNSDSNYSLSLNLQYEYGLNGAVQEGYASGVIDLTTPPVTP